MEALVHVAYGAYLLSYSVKDILWLRIITVVGSTLVIWYYLTLSEVLWEPLGWNVVFIGINVVQIVLLLMERRPVRLTSEEEQLYSMAFRTLTPREFKGLMQYAEWRNGEPDEILIQQGEELQDIVFVFSGSVDIQRDGRSIAKCNKGQFLGEMSFVSGEVTSASVQTLEPTCYVAWPAKELHEVCEKKAELKYAIQTIFGNGMVEKLKAA